MSHSIRLLTGLLAVSVWLAEPLPAQQPSGKTLRAVPNAKGRSILRTPATVPNRQTNPGSTTPRRVYGPTTTVVPQNPIAPPNRDPAQSGSNYRGGNPQGYGRGGGYPGYSNGPGFGGGYGFRGGFGWGRSSTNVFITPPAYGTPYGPLDPWANGTGGNPYGAVSPYGTPYGASPYVNPNQFGPVNPYTATPNGGYGAGFPPNGLPQSTNTPLPGDPFRTGPIVDDPAARTPLPPRASSEAKRRESDRYRAEGDRWFAMQNFNKALMWYDRAYNAAKDVPQNSARIGFTRLAAGQYDRAVGKFKFTLALDPAWPSHATGLKALLGEGNLAAFRIHIDRVMRWTQEDLYDPNRLFLLGLVIHPTQPEQAQTLFEAALKLERGRGDHIVAFLRTEPNPVVMDDPNAVGPLAVPGANTPDANGDEPGPFPELPAPEPPQPIEADPDLLPPANLYPEATDDNTDGDQTNGDTPASPVTNRIGPQLIPQGR